MVDSRGSEKGLEQVEVNVTTDVFNMALLALPESSLSGSVLFLALL
jgi:hypothetical protein